MEGMLIAQVRHTCCFICVSSGMRKMKANMTAFESSMPKVYAQLPLPKADMDDILTVLYCGLCKPTSDNFKQTLLLSQSGPR
jgi:hypothetical protein